MQDHITIEHVAREKHTVANFLSRLPDTSQGGRKSPSEVVIELLKGVWDCSKKN